MSNDRYCTARIAELERQNEELRQNIDELKDINFEQTLKIEELKKEINQLENLLEDYRK